MLARALAWVEHDLAGAQAHRVCIRARLQPCRNAAEKPRALAPGLRQRYRTWNRRGLKPGDCWHLVARLKPCPDTMHDQSVENQTGPTASEVAPRNVRIPKQSLDCVEHDLAGTQAHRVCIRARLQPCRNAAEKPRALAPGLRQRYGAWNRRGLKPGDCWRLAARLKPCPDTMHDQPVKNEIGTTASEVAPRNMRNPKQSLACARP
jgi:uncharacterized protein (DUF2237 family)